ncbi:hypothetical protein V8F20_008635 [Naviculisporaceae sp. PSN 640]
MPPARQECPAERHGLEGLSGFSGKTFNRRHCSHSECFHWSSVVGLRSPQMLLDSSWKCRAGCLRIMASDRFLAESFHWQLEVYNEIPRGFAFVRGALFSQKGPRTVVLNGQNGEFICDHRPACLLPPFSEPSKRQVLGSISLLEYPSIIILAHGKMPPSRKGRRAERQPFYKKSRGARRLAREAEDLERDAAGSDQSGQAEVTEEVTADLEVSSGVDVGSVSVRGDQMESKLADRETLRPLKLLRKRTKGLKMGVEKGRKTLKALQEMVETQAKMIEHQAQQIRQLKDREETLDYWREQTHDALEFLLWDREGPNQGCYQDRKWGLWNELEDFHRQ